MQNPPHAWLRSAPGPERRDLLSGILDGVRPGGRMPPADREQVRTHLAGIRSAGFLDPPELAIADVILARVSA